MHKLAGVTFVQSVQSPALAMVVPLLTKGLKVNKTATRRQSSVIIDNMSKLVDDPLDAAPFLPTLLPALERAAEAISDPEARGVAENAVTQRRRLGAEGKAFKGDPRMPDFDKVKALVLKEVPGMDKKGKGVPLTHLCNLICALLVLKKFDDEDWEIISKNVCLFGGIAADAATKKVTLTLPLTLNPNPNPNPNANPNPTLNPT